MRRGGEIEERKRENAETTGERDGVRPRERRRDEDREEEEERSSTSVGDPEHRRFPSALSLNRALRACSRRAQIGKSRGIDDRNDCVAIDLQKIYV